MVARANTALESLETTLASGEVLDLAAFLHGRELTDVQLAELIESDGRAMMDRGRRLDLSRYLDAWPGLEQMPVALDAAIEFSLRSLSGSSRPTDEAIEELARRHPHLSREIRNAAALSAGLATTRTLRRLDAGPKPRALPCPFGPLTEEGWARYELRRKLGSGSQGEVLLAVDRVMSEPDREAMVAIKVSPAGMLTAADRWRAIDEATRARRVDHPNVVRALDRGTTEEGEVYIVYEHVDGGDLDGLLRQRPVNDREAAALMARIARGVQAAHAAGLVHRDLKPANILLTRQGVPRVADFGCAAPIDDDGAVDDDRVGNLAFIAPEQFRGGAGAQSASVDVYALGGILFYMLTGVLPHGATPASVRRKLGGDRAVERLDVREHRRDIDPDLAAIVARATAADVELRTPTAEALASDLETWLRREPLAWTHPSLLRRARLLTVRSPRQVALGLIAAAVALAAGAVSLLVWAEARGRVREAEIDRLSANAYAQAQHRTEQAVIDRIRQIEMNLVVRDLEPTDWMPVLTILESMLGPRFFSVDGMDRRRWENRILAARETIAESEADGTGDSLQTLLWRDVLTYWLLRSDQFDAALTEATRADAGWQARLSKEDPWNLVRQAFRSIAVVELAKSGLKRGEAAEGRPEVVLAAERLRAAETYLDHTQPGSALHLFVLESIYDAYGPRMLDKADDRTWARRKRNLLGNEAMMEREEIDELLTDPVERRLERERSRPAAGR